MKPLALFLTIALAGCATLTPGPSKLSTSIARAQDDTEQLTRDIGGTRVILSRVDAKAALIESWLKLPRK